MSTKRKIKSKSKRAVGLNVTKKKAVRNTGRTVDEIAGMLSEDMFGRLFQSIGPEAFEEFALDLAVRFEDILRDETDPDYDPEDALLQLLDEYRMTHPEFTK
jgi:hypothetical protein